MLVPIIYTLDAREHGFLEGMARHNQWTTQQSYEQINYLAIATIDILAKKKIKYADLKNALIPHTDKKEIAFVFDSRLVDSSIYGAAIFEVLIPLMDKVSVNSILLGDYIGEEGNRDMLRELFFDHIHQHKEINYRHHGLFFIVYLNHLSDGQFAHMHEGLKKMDAYVGYFDLTYSSRMKTVISTILVKAILKYKTTIINPTEARIDENWTGYDFEGNGYKVIGMEDLTYGMYLSYKIEREVYLGYETDNDFSLNAMSGEVRDLSEMDLIIEEKKLAYLLSDKTGNMERAGFQKLSVDELSELIRKKLKDNYLFNLSFLPEYQKMKFNIMIETPRTDKEAPMKLLVALEYAPLAGTLRLITMY